MATTNKTHVNFVKVPTMSKFNDITTKADGTIYFIVDAKKIYLDGVEYGFNDSDVADKFLELTGGTLTGDLNITDGDQTTTYLNRGINFPDTATGLGRYISAGEHNSGLYIGVGGTVMWIYEENISLFHGQGDDPVGIHGVADPVYDSSAINKKYLETNVIDKIGEANGIASLDEKGYVPSGQLPSYVDDVLEYSKKESFPAEGESGKLYIDLSNNKVWRWSGSTYVNVSDGNAHLTLGNTPSTAYRGDRGLIAYNHSTITTGNPHGVTASDVGLGQVENYPIATEAEAKAGSSGQYMTPQRTKQAIEVWAPKLTWTVVA